MFDGFSIAMEIEMKIFLCWWGGGYTRSMGEHELSWFSTDRGYEQDDIDEVAELKVGASMVLSNGDHIVTRVE